MLTLRLIALPVLCSLLACTQSPGPLFLSRPGVGSADEAAIYYRNIAAEPTFAEWLSHRCFDQPGAETVKAFYYNDSDLGLGREMQCAICPQDAARNPGLISCAVSNHGVPREVDLAVNGRVREQSIKKALGDLERFLAGGNAKRGASVAMDYLPGRTPDAVRFYIYDGEDPAKLQPGNTVPTGLIPGLQLDTEGVKFIRNCLSCHGGRYDEGRNLILGSSFLDFDVSLFVFGDDPIITAAAPAAGDMDFTAMRTRRLDNQEPLRALNSVVLRSSPAPAIAARIRGSYPGCDVAQAGCQYQDGYVPDGWKARPEDTQLFTEAVHKHCTTCHFSQNPAENLQSEKEAQRRPWIFDTAAQWFADGNPAQIRRTTCESSDMPHAEVTRTNLKRNAAAFSALCVTPR